MSSAKRIVIPFLVAVASVELSRAAHGAVYTSPPQPLPTELLPGDVLNVVDYFGGGYITNSAQGSVINLKPGGGFYGAVLHGTIYAEPGSLGVASGLIDGGRVYAHGGIFSIPSMNNGAYFEIHGATVYSLTSFGGVVDFRSGTLQSGSLSNTVANFYATTGDGEIALQGNTVVNVYGGAFTETLGSKLWGNGDVHLYMQSARVDGQEIAGLDLGDTHVIAQRNVTLTGVLKDGSPVSMAISPFDSISKYAFYDDSVISVTLVPEPTAAAVGIAACTGLAVRRRRGSRP